MKYIGIFLAICLVLSSAVKMDENSEFLSSTDSNAQLASQLAALEETPIGSMVTLLAEIHLELGGPVDGLVKAIKELAADLQVKIKKEDDTFNRATTLHKNRVVELTAQINSATEDVGHATQKLQNILIPRKRRLTAEINTLKTNIASNERTQKSETDTRNKEHAAYLVKSKEHQDALKAIDEAIKLVDSLKNKKPSLIEIRSAKTSLKKIESTLVGQQSVFSPLIQALLELSQSFSDQTTVKKILDLLNKLRANVVKSLQNFTEVENKSQAAFNARLAQLKKENTNFRNTLAARSSDLADTNTKIKSEHAFKVRRSAELAKYKKQLNDENATYQKLLAAHNDLVAEFKKEVVVIGQAINILKNVKVPAYLKARANK